MAYKTFVVERVEDESTQTAGPATLNRADVPPLVKVFGDESDIVLSTLSTNEIVATKNTDYSSVAVVDRVAGGNLNPVTSNAVANALSYSTTETPTGGYWIDGKPIYRAVFYTDNWVDNSTYDASALDIDEVTNLKAMWFRSGNWFEAPYSGSGGFFSSIYYISGSNLIAFDASATHAGSKNRTVIEYTKTTD